MSVSRNPALLPKWATLWQIALLCLSVAVHAPIWSGSGTAIALDFALTLGLLTNAVASRRTDRYAARVVAITDWCCTVALYSRIVFALDMIIAAYKTGTPNPRMTASAFVNLLRTSTLVYNSAFEERPLLANGSKPGPLEKKSVRTGSHERGQAA
jgi:hypothetical protein